MLKEILGDEVYFLYFIYVIQIWHKFTLDIKFNEHQQFFMLYLIFYGIYGPYKKIGLKRCLIRGIFSTFVLIILTMTQKGKLW